MATRNVMFRIAEQTIPATLSASTLAQYAKQEITLPTLPAFTNPYDPAEVSVVATFTKPGGGTISVLGYYDVPYSLILDTYHYVQFTANGSPVWRVRFTPTLVGTYSGSITIITRDHGATTVAIPSFVCTSSADHGFLKLAPSGKFLQFSDGAFFHPVGANLATSFQGNGSWLGSDVSGVEQALRALNGAGGNAARWCQSVAYKGGLMWTNPTNNTYNLWPGYNGLMVNQMGACAIDQVFALSESLGIYTADTISLGAAVDETVTGYYGHSDNPYFDHQGGPCTTTLDFFTNATAKTLYKRELRYFIARYGYSTHLWAIEHLAELDWALDNLVTAYGATYRDSVVTAAKVWCAEMNAYIRSIDPYGHLLCIDDGQGYAPYVVSHVGNSVHEGFIAAGNYDLHFNAAYKSQFSGNPNVVSVKNTLEAIQAVAAIPVLISEWGVDSGSSTGDLADTAGIGIHNTMWVSAMRGSGAFPWYARANYATDNYLAHITALQAFMAGENWEADYGSLSQSARRLAVSCSSGSCEVYGIGGGNKARVWVHQTASIESSGTPGTISGASVTITGLNSGTYDVQLWDTYAGTYTTPAQVFRSGGQVVVPLSSFTRDIAVKLTWQSAHADSTLWYLSGGIPLANCIAAYQPKGAASLAASYVNLASPGTLDATLGVAPTWDAVNGWVFNGTTQYLKTGIIPTIPNYSIVVQFTNMAQTAVVMALAGELGGADTTTILIRKRADNTYQIYNGASNTAFGAAMAAGNFAVCGKNPYRNGVLGGTPAPAGSAVTTRDIWIGGYNSAGTLTSPALVDIQAIAIYNIDVSSYMAALYAAMAAL